MEITAAMVMSLRNKSGAGIMDCKKALKECDGDLEQAFEALRKKGAEMADAKSSRVAREGVIVNTLSEDRTMGALVEVNCETDFVGRGDVFRGFALPLGELALTIGEDCDDVNVLIGMTLASGESVEEARREIIAKVGENVTVSRLSVFKAAQDGQVATYSHHGRIGVLLELSGDSDHLGTDLAMHVAGMRPRWVGGDDVPEDVLAKEREIFADQARQTNKPEAIIEKIIDGRIRKFKEENTLLGQNFVRDQEVSVASLVKSKNATVVRFSRLEIGEGAE